MTSLICTEAIHSALKSDDAAWSQLEYVNTIRMEYGDGGPDEMQEARNCRCGSTLYRCWEVEL